MENEWMAVAFEDFKKLLITVMDEVGENVDQLDFSIVSEEAIYSLSVGPPGREIETLPSKLYTEDQVREMIDLYRRRYLRKPRLSYFYDKLFLKRRS